MRIKNNQFGKWGVTLLFALFICSCSSPVETSPKKLPEGFGSFSLRVDASRTILPPAPTINSFAVYTLAFTAISGGTETVDRTNDTLATSPVILKVGTYSLIVSAYLDAEKTQLAARGTPEEDIEITSGESVSKTVTLKTLGSEGEGTFSYNVTIDTDDVTSAEMAITKNGTAISESPVTLDRTGEVTSGSLTLDSGVYNIRFTLIKGGAVKEEAVWNEILYVYAELTSSFSITFDKDYFYRTHYNVTFRYNDGDDNEEEEETVTTQSVAHGGALTAPAPTRTGYTFEGWHTDSGLTVLYSSAPVYNDFTLYAKWEEVPPDPTDWEAVTDSTFGSVSGIFGIAYGDGKFVAVGQGNNYSEGKIAYSSDGITWTAVTNSTFGTTLISAIAYGNGKFVAVGHEGKMAYSTGGLSWIAVSNSPFGTSTNGNSDIFGITYGDGKFVAVGSLGKMAYSTDGANWTDVLNSTFTSSINAIAYGDGTFVACEGGGRMAYSTDNGVTWTDVLNSTFTSSINAIAYGDGTFVACGGGGRMAYSTDNGVTWTAVSNSTFAINAAIRGIAYGGDNFIVVGQGYRIAYSTDGVNWTAVSNSAFDNNGFFYGIAYGDGKFVAVGNQGIIAVCTP